MEKEGGKSLSMESSSGASAVSAGGFSLDGSSLALVLVLVLVPVETIGNGSLFVCLGSDFWMACLYVIFPVLAAFSEGCLGGLVRALSRLEASSKPEETLWE